MYPFSVFTPPCETAAAADAFAVSDTRAKQPTPVLNGARETFFNDLPAAPLAPDATDAAAGFGISSDEVLRGIFLELQKPSTPASAIDALVAGPAVGLMSVQPGITSSSLNASYDFLGPSVNGREYAEAYVEGVNGLRALGTYLALSPEQLASADAEGARAGIASYAHAEKSVYAEGISYGWTVSHALEFYKNSVYDAGRTSMVEGGTGQEPIDVVGFNFGLNMTDLNKRDPSGRLGDILRDRMRQLANAEFGEKVWDGGYPGNGVRSADNIAATKNMTVLVMGGQNSELTEERAKEGLARVQKGLEAYVRSAEFNRRMVDAHGECASKIDLGGVRIGLAGYFGRTSIRNDAAAKGALENKIVDFLGELHHGEDAASKTHRMAARNEATYVHVRSVAGGKGAAKATHELYGLYRSSSPGTDATWKPGTPADDRLDVTESDVRSGDVLRPGHDFGIGFRHVKEIKQRFQRLQDAINAYKAVRGTEPAKMDTALARVAEARDALREYVERPPEAIDPARVGVVERFASDFGKSKKIYRFRTADGKDLVVYKPDHMQEVMVDAARKAQGKQWVVSMELGKVGDYMRAYAAHDGIKDPVFAQIFDFVTSGLKAKGFEVEMAVMGGDEFLVHVREGNKGKQDNAGLRAALGEVISQFEAAHKARPYNYSEKAPLPGGKWKGLQFGVKGERLYFKKPGDMPAAEFEARRGEVLADEAFRHTVRENFPSVTTLDRPSSVSAEDFGKLGSISRRGVWHLEGSPHELYLEPGVACATKGARQPERTLTMEASFAPMTDARDIPVLVNTVLPEGIQHNKKAGSSVSEMPGLTAAQRRNTRLEERFAYSAGTFMMASISSKIIVNAMRGRDMMDGVDAIETLGTWGAMSAGAASTELAYRLGAAAVAGKLFVVTKAGVRRLNVDALRRAPVGGRAVVMGAFVTVGALSAVQLWEDGKVDLVSLGNSIFLIQSAKYVTRGLELIGPLRKATSFNPVKLLVEFLVMEGLGVAEEAAVEDYYRTQKRNAMASAMRDVDAAIEAMRKAKAEQSVEAFASAHAAYDKAQQETQRAFNDLMTFEKYTGADEYAIVHDAQDDVRGLEGDLERIENTEGHPDAMPGWQKAAYMGPMSGSAGVTNMRLPRSMVEDIRRRRRATYAAAKEAAYDSVRKAEERFFANTRSLSGSVRASSLHIPFEFERNAYVEVAARARERAKIVPVESVELRMNRGDSGKTSDDLAREGWSDRYYDRLSDDPHRLMLQYALFMRERELYLNRSDSNTAPSAASDGD
jgi:hypothetical protein